MQSGEACAKFRAMLQHAPSVDCSVDVDSHVALQNAYILYAAQQCFVKQRQSKKKPWISDHSMNLVRQKRAAVRVWMELRRKWRWSALQRIFVVWRDVRSGKIPHFLVVNAASANVCHAKRHCKRKGGVTSGC